MITQTIFQDHDVYEMTNGTARALVAPQFGARLLTMEVDGAPVLYWPDDADWSSVAHVRGGNPILFPFVARHNVDGVLGRWRDNSGVVRELPMHGFARDMAFEVVADEDPNTLRMRLAPTDATREMYPYEWLFDVVYHLGERELTTTLETTNTGDTHLPYYAGHHYYFAVPHGDRAQWKLTLPCRRWGWQNPDGSVRFADAAQRTALLDDAGLLDRFQLDFKAEPIRLERVDGSRLIYVHLDGIEAGSNNIPWYDVTTWTQSPESDFFCVEPWLGLPNAIHHNLGLRQVKPGVKETAVCRIAVAG